MTNLMRWSFLVLCLWNCTLSFAGEIPWAESFLAARNQAEYERKLILIHFYADDCPPCQIVEEDVFTDQEVQAAIKQNYVTLKVHAKRTPALAQKYSVHRWPTDVIVSHAGQEIFRTISPQSPVKYAAMLNGIALQGGVGAGRLTAEQAPATAAAQTAAAPTKPMGATAAAWNDNGTPPQNYNTSPGMVMNPWVNQAAQATENAGRAAQQWGGYAQQGSQAAQQFMQQPPATGQAAAQMQGAAQQYQAAAQESAQRYQAAAQQTLGQYQQAAQQTAGQYQQAAQQTANQFQTAAQQTATQWQAEAGQVQQKLNQYQAAASQGVDNYSAAAQQQFSQYNNAAQQQAQTAATTAGQTVETFRRSANSAVDNIANATTMPSQLPPRRSTYGGGDLVTDVAPQPGRISEGTNEVPRTTTIRSGEMTMQSPTGAAWQPNAPPLAPAAPSGFEQASAPYGSTPPTTSRSNAFAGYVPPANAAPNSAPPTTPGPYSNYPANTAPVAPAGNTPWNVPPANQPAPETAANTRGTAWPGTPSATGTDTSRSWNADPTPVPNLAANPAPSAPAAPNQSPTATWAPNPPPMSASPTSPPPPRAPQQQVSAPAQFALDGFCPVTMIETKKWTKGDPRFGAVHCGQTYLFVSAAEQQKFLGSPDRYAPVLACNDPVRYADAAQLVAGNRKHGIIYKQQIYLFADEGSLMQFSKSPDRYAGTAYQAMIERDRNQMRR